MDKKQGAVIGIHGIGKHHGTLMEGTGRIAVRAVCDVNEEMREVAAEHFPEAQFYTSAEAMLGEQTLDVVSLAVPHSLHAPLAIAALDAGVNVIVEKPMATHYRDCVAMIEAAQRNDRFLTVFHNRRLDGWFLSAKSVIDDGLLGDVFEINTGIGGFGKSTTWRGVKEASGGVIFDWGAHLVDYSLHFAGSKVKAVSGFFYRADDSAPESNEDHGAARIYFESGAIANVTVSARDFVRPHRYKILGTKGTLIDEWNWGEDAKLEVHTRLSGGEDAVMRVPYHDSSRQEYYDNVADHLCDGKELMVTPESAALVINILETAGRSSQQGGVPLPLED